MRTLRNTPIVWGVVLATCALALGYAGYRSLPGPTMSASDALFSSLQLFALEGALPADGTPWPLNIARFMAPVAVLYATVVTLLTILREQVQRALVAAFARDHIVLVGLGRSSALLAASLRRSGSRVVVVEADVANERIAGIRALGARVVIGDATQSVILQRAQSVRARHVIVATGDDSQNLEVAELVRRVAIREGKGRRITVHVAIANLALWAELGRLQLARIDTGVVLEFFNMIDRAAQSLLNEAERLSGHSIFDRVMVEGDGEFAQRTLVHLVRRAVLSGRRPELYVSASTYERVLAPLLAREPWIAQWVDLREPVPTVGAFSVPVVLVCIPGSDARAIACALTLATPSTGRAVYVSVDGQNSDTLLESVGIESGVHLVPTSLRAITQEFVHQSGPELMARVRHEDYLAQERSRGSTAQDNPSLVAWEALPESLKESNRRFAESVGEVVDALGGYLVPLRQLELEAAFPDDDATMDRLARGEHDRWMSSLRGDGWTYSSTAKDPVRKTHPLLVAWSELTEAEKEKDRDAIRAIPRMLARVGFAIRLAEPSVGAGGSTSSAS